jgi:OmpA-OmpF porin, OOP family
VSIGVNGAIAKDMSVENQQVQVLDALDSFERTLHSQTDDADMIAQVISKIQFWTGGQPFMTKLLGNYVIEQVAELQSKQDAGTIDVLVQQKIINDWEINGAANHLKKIEKTLLSYRPRDSLLILYLQILQRGPLLQDHSLEQETLLRCGLVSLKDERLSVSHAIYASIFNEDWIERQLPGITKPIVVIRSAPKSAKSSAKSAQKALAVRLNQPSFSFKLPLKATLLTCGLAVLTAATLTHFRRGATWGWSNPTEVATAGERAGVTAEGAEVVAAEASFPGATRLTLLGDSFSGYSTFRNAEFQAVLRESDIQIDYADEFDQTLRAEKLSEGKADLIVTTLDQFLQQQPKGKIVGLLDHTVGADAVVLNTKRYASLNSLLDLKKLVERSRAQGQKLSITYASDTPSEYLALVLDIKFDTFNLSDFELKPVADASEAWDLMQDPNENVAIAVLWEPYVAQARQQGYSVVLSSQDSPDAIIDVLVASDKLIQSNPGVLSTLLEKYYRRIDANTRDSSQLQAQVAEDGELSLTDAATIINGIDFFTAAEARSWLQNGTLEKRLGSTAAVLTLSERLKAVPADVPALYTEKFIAEAADNTQALIDIVKADNPKLAEQLAGNGQAVKVTAAVPASAAQIQQATDIGNFQVRGQVDFDTGSAQLTEEGKQALNQLSDELKEFNEETIAVRVIGHTSRTGDERANQALSQQRASVVVNLLKAQGVILTIVPEGRGSSEPLSAADPANVSNQRTEIRLVRLNKAE